MPNHPVQSQFQSTMVQEEKSPYKLKDKTPDKEYLCLVQRLQAETSSLQSQVSQLKTELTETKTGRILLQNESHVHSKIEHDLQQKIKSLQSENCAFQKDKACRLREEQDLRSKFKKLELLFKELEMESANKEDEVRFVAGQN